MKKKEAGRPAGLAAPLLPLGPPHHRAPPRPSRALPRAPARPAPLVRPSSSPRDRRRAASFRSRRMVPPPPRLARPPPSLTLALPRFPYAMTEAQLPFSFPRCSCRACTRHGIRVEPDESAPPLFLLCPWPCLSTPWTRGHPREPACQPLHALFARTPRRTLRRAADPSPGCVQPDAPRHP